MLRAARAAGWLAAAGGPRGLLRAAQGAAVAACPPRSCGCRCAVPECLRVLPGQAMPRGCRRRLLHGSLWERRLEEGLVGPSCGPAGRPQPASAACHEVARPKHGSKPAWSFSWRGFWRGYLWFHPRGGKPAVILQAACGSAWRRLCAPNPPASKAYCWEAGAGACGGPWLSSPRLLAPARKPGGGVDPPASLGAAPGAAAAACRGAPAPPV